MATTDPALDLTEHDLLALIRLAATGDFMLLVTCDTGRWTVATEDLVAGTKVIGTGPSLADAWSCRTEIRDDRQP